MNLVPFYKNPKIVSFSAWVFILSIPLCITWGDVSEQSNSSCNRTRTIITNSTWGIISDGKANYTQDSYCEWLIEADPQNYITLKIHQVRTECSYDYLFVFDGDSYTRNTTLLASFSGASIHSVTLLARTGKMLILLYSDTNYALEGFQAEYFVTKCPLNCSESQNAGKCIPSFKIGDEFSPRHRCSCFPSHSGEGCEVSNKDLDYLLIPSNSYPNLFHRVGHSAIRVHHKVYIFGGFNLNQILNDLKIYDLDTGQIHEYNPLESQLSDNLTENDIRLDLVWPQARYGHASAEYKSGFFVHGGRLSNGGGISDELFYFNVTSLKWTRVAGNFEGLPRLMYHSMTTANEGKIYVYGGGTPSGSFSSKLYKFHGDSARDASWEEVVSVCCGKPKDRSVLGHSAVYWKAEKAIIFYGGVTIDNGRFSKISSQMFLYSVESRIWTEIHYRKAYQNYNSYSYKSGGSSGMGGGGMGSISSWSHTERAFHTMDIIGHHLLVIGGYTHAHNKDETCYSNQMLIYNLDCQQFVPGSSPRIQGHGHSVDGIFGHQTSVYRDRVYIFGGYRGYLEGRVRSITLPFKSHRSNDGECLHSDRWSCSSDPHCGWCPSDEKCYEKLSGSKNCTTNLQTAQCSGKCPLLTNCQACVSMGCQWCDVTEQCWEKSQNQQCGSKAVSGDYKSCIRNYDRQGVTVFEYRHPLNLDYPDTVKIVNSTVFKLQRESSNYIHSESSTAMVIKGSLMGVIQSPRRIELCGAQAKVNLTMENEAYSGTSFNYNNINVHQSVNPKILSVIQGETLSAQLKWTADVLCTNLTWPSGLAVLLHPDTRIRFEISTNTSLATPNTPVRVILQLKMVARNSSATPGTSPVVVPTPFRVSKESLMPFITSNTSCVNYSSCLNCVGDAACIWVNGKSCVSRFKTSQLDEQVLRDVSIVLTPDDCPQCSDRNICTDCVTGRGSLSNATTPECEWWEEESSCNRYGRSDSAVRSTNACPVNCHVRKNCSSCLEGPGKCVWCADRQECFVFDVYTSFYQYGQCVHWLDKSDQCQRCARQSSCDECIRYLGCGWNYDENGGSCTEGDFQGPFGSTDGDWIVMTSAKGSNNTENKQMTWAYATCPDMDECALGIHDCHENATCENTPGSFSCKCKQGFTGDGKKNCDETCFEPCVHGTCSSSFICECDLGWTGVDCSIDCGCYNHSSCETGGCDECQDWTMGQNCQFCKPGSYGNATDGNIGCRPCECNGHGDENFGQCNITTGECYCLNNTSGPECSLCDEGFFGNPVNGAPCYKDCVGRAVMESQFGYIGVSPSSSVRKENMKSLFLASLDEPTVEHCMWILKLNESASEDEMQKPRRVRITISPMYNIPCWENSLTIYSGIPSFTKARKDASLVASVCSPESVIMSSEDSEVRNHQGRRRFFQRSNSGRELNIYVDSDLVSIVLRSIPNSMGYMNDTQNIYFSGSYEFLKDIDSSMPPGPAGLPSGSLSFTLEYSKIPVTRLYDGQSVFSRFGHSLHADEKNVWIFGGYSLSHGALNDVRQFSRDIGKWIPLTILIVQNEDSAPLPRYFHAGALGPNNDDIFVHGGLASNMSFLGDTWRFDTRVSKWSKIGKRFTSALRLAGHTMTLRKKSLTGVSIVATGEEDHPHHHHSHHVGIHQLVIIGGMSADHGFANRTWVLRLDSSAAASGTVTASVPDTNPSEEWEEVSTSGAPPIGLYGHSTIYHEITDSFYVFGGVSYDMGRVKISSSLYALHWPTKRWTVLPPTEDNQIFKILPVPKFFHTAVSTDSYMVVLGGSGSSHNTSILAYNFKCNLWTLLEGESRLLDRTGGAASISGNDLLFMGGWDWGGATTSESLYKLVLPKDICSVQTASERCKATHGCSYCFSNNNQSQQCYNAELPMPTECSSRPKNHTELIKVNYMPGTVCSKHWVESRNCNQYLTCTDCLSTWPSHSDAKPVCQWCTNCQIGRCIPIGKKCQEENHCNHKQRETLDVNQCAERTCAASGCNKCIGSGKCVWTRQILRSSEWSWKLHPKPVYDWNCVRKAVFNSSTTTYKVIASPPEQCPAMCSSFSTCETCLSAVGGEGGFQECWWSVGKNLCVSPAHVYLMCFGGVCGPILKDDIKVCPKPCSSFTSCAGCLQNPSCGWCATEGKNGEGQCLPGDSISSQTHNCSSPTTFLLESENETATEVTHQLSWNYQKCPAENECANFHHTCNDSSEKCIDLDDGYRCECKEGYRLDLMRKVCLPICDDGCVHGTCVSPGKCACHFGYVGHNCSAQCNCNGHSNCAGVNDLNNCTECKNDTMGPQCSKCKPLFVGDPRNGRPCISCFDYCNGHSNICMPRKVHRDMCGSKQTSEVELLSFIQANPSLFMNDADSSIGLDEAHVCCGCGDKTKGSKCEDCIEGYFRGSDDKRKSCRKCECHGHGYLCDPVYGTDCNCQNNTESEHCGSSPTKSSQCWKSQCAKCKESYLGNPTNGHQCYKHMFVDNEYCFGPNYQESCVAAHQSLQSGRTVFFAVQPKFMNVNIRINLDVNRGAVHVYLSPKDDTFIVEHEGSTFMHQVRFDGKYGLNGHHIPDRGSMHQDEAAKDSIGEITRSQLLPNLTTHEEDSLSQTIAKMSYAGLTSSAFRLVEEEAAGFATHVTLQDPKAVLVVRNVRNRLVITLPQDTHELRVTRFYIVLEGVGDKSYGTLSFRQDQLHIDLFVFFSVFFSAFFLFLAACGIAWKFKQNMEARRARHRHVAEMLSMAKRPFAIWTLLLEPDPSSPLYPAYNQCRKSCRKGCICKRPLAIESTQDGVAGVCTMMVSLPGGSAAPVRVCLASTLAYANRSHPPIHVRRRRR